MRGHDWDGAPVAESGVPHDSFCPGYVVRVSDVYNNRRVQPLRPALRKSIPHNGKFRSTQNLLPDDPNLSVNRSETAMDCPTFTTQTTNLTCSPECVAGRDANRTSKGNLGACWWGFSGSSDTGGSGVSSGGGVTGSGGRVCCEEREGQEWLLVKNEPKTAPPSTLPRLLQTCATRWLFFWAFLILLSTLRMIFANTPSRSPIALSLEYDSSPATPPPVLKPLTFHFLCENLL